jgi:hypothetical protein
MMVPPRCKHHEMINILWMINHVLSPIGNKCRWLSTNFVLS